jgi:hypothetical protein
VEREWAEGDTRESCGCSPEDEWRPESEDVLCTGTLEDVDFENSGHQRSPGIIGPPRGGLRRVSAIACGLHFRLQRGDNGVPPFCGRRQLTVKADQVQPGAGTRTASRSTSSSGSNSTCERTQRLPRQLELLKLLRLVQERSTSSASPAHTRQRRIADTRWKRVSKQKAWDLRCEH